MMILQMDAVFENLKREVKSYFEGINPCHGFDHIERVINLAIKIGEVEDADLGILKLSALLHDIGGENLDSINGNLVLDFADGNEEFIALGDTENDSPIKGEVVYKDDKGVICRRWNWREAERTKLTSETKNAIVVIENILKEDKDRFDFAFNQLGTLILEFCDAKIRG